MPITMVSETRVHLQKLLWGRTCHHSSRSFLVQFCFFFFIPVNIGACELFQLRVAGLGVHWPVLHLSFSLPSSLPLSLSVCLFVFFLSLSPFAPVIIASFEVLVWGKFHFYLMTEPNLSRIDPSSVYQTFTQMHFLCSIWEESPA